MTKRRCGGKSQITTAPIKNEGNKAKGEDYGCGQVAKLLYPGIGVINKGHHRNP